MRHALILPPGPIRTPIAVSSDDPPTRRLLSPLRWTLSDSSSANQQPESSTLLAFQVVVPSSLLQSLQSVPNAQSLKPM